MAMSIDEMLAKIEAKQLKCPKCGNAEHIVYTSSTWDSTALRCEITGEIRSMDDWQTDNNGPGEFPQHRLLRCWHALTPYKRDEDGTVVPAVYCGHWWECDEDTYKKIIW